MSAEDTCLPPPQALSRNGLLQGDELAVIGGATADLARHQHAKLLAEDRAGECVIGAATTPDPSGWPEPIPRVEMIMTLGAEYIRSSSHPTAA